MTFDHARFGTMPDVPRFEVMSTDVTEGERLPSSQRSGKMSVPGGEDVSAQLSWSGFPTETKSFIVSMFDPDAPTGSGWWHWCVANVSPEITELPTDAGAEDSDAMPEGSLTVTNDAGFAGYLGAAPPAGHGEHRYVFAVHALDVESLEVEPAASGAMVMFSAYGHVLARGWIETSFGLE